MSIRGPVVAALALACAGFAPVPAGGEILSRWVQYLDDGKAEIRAVTGEAACPEVVIDGNTVAMAERAGPAAGFAGRVCVAPVPEGTKAAEIEGVRLSLPKARPDRILLLGDTGCRIKGVNIQACADPEAWPFPRLAAAAAALRPDLVIHVGDYLYRESSCPPGMRACSGPYGDNWPSWAADFFTPAAPLLHAAPWVFVRGNHEDCDRAGPGWFRLLGPGAAPQAKACEPHLAPYAVDIGGTQLVVIDDSDVPDRGRDDGKALREQAEFTAPPVPPGAKIWLLMHKAPRAALTLLPGVVSGNIATLAAASEDGFAPGVELLVAGHIHAFEAINFVQKLPPQLLVGNGGDKLDEAPEDLHGIEIGNKTIADGITIPGFGFLLFRRGEDGWNGEGYDAAGSLVGRCILAAKRLDCKGV